MNKPEQISSREDAERMYELGYRPRTIWVLDTGLPEVREGIEKEVEAIRRADDEEDVMAWIEAVSAELPPYDGPDYS